MNEKTIAAISTPTGTGGIAVIRMSGAAAVEIANRVFCGGARLLDVPTHTVHYGHITEADGTPIDEVLVTVMRAPRSFTGEDVVEIGTHGGITASRMVLRRLIEAGAYPAEAGEFSKRAFLNGKIDLAAAEGIIDIINSKNELAEKNALRQLSGGLSSKIEEIRSALVSLAAKMQVIIDYPDEELEEVGTEDICRTAKEQLARVTALLHTAQRGKVITDGIVTAIVGRPNVGKSSLLNMLSGENRAIVTDIAGTTRDIIEETVNLGGVMLRLTDTAGIRDTEDSIERLGVEKSLDAIERADLILTVLDATRPLSREDSELLLKTEHKRRIVIINKCDLADSVPADGIRISAKTGEGLDVLTEKIRELYELGKIEQDDTPIVTNARHSAALTHAAEFLRGVADGAAAGIPSDILSIDLNNAIDALGEITGSVVSEDIVSEIFHSFCVGK